MPPILLVVTTLLYFSVVLVGILAAVPIAIAKHQLGGKCLLFGHVSFPENTNDTKGMEINAGQTTLCDFITYMHVVASLAFGLLMTVLHTVACFRKCHGAMRDCLQNLVVKAIFLILHGATSLVTVAGAFIITIGFTHFCKSVTDRGFTSCKSFQDVVPWGELNHGDGSGFHLSYMVSLAACWICFFLWGLLTAITAITCVRQRRERMASLTTEVPTKNEYELAPTEEPKPSTSAVKEEDKSPFGEDSTNPFGEDA